MKNIILPIFIVLSLTFINTNSTLACFAIIAGRKATTDGSILIGHNEQNSGIRFLNFRKIPPMKYSKEHVIKLQNGGTSALPPETYGYLWTQNPGCAFSDLYINDKGVTVVTDYCPDRGEKNGELEKDGQLKDGGIAYMLRRMIAMTANTAKEGVIIAGNIISHWGYAGSRTLAIADSNEAWVLCATQGKQWAALRIPDDEVIIIPNVYTLENIDFNDKENFICSKNLVSYAVKKGWYDPKSGKPFNFAEIYSKPRENLIDPRQLTAHEIITGEKVDTSKNERLPFSVKPTKKLSVKDMIEILRFFKDIDVYNGINITDLGNPDVISAMKKARQDTGNLCTPRTQEASVFQLNSKYPPAIGCIYWKATAEPSAVVLTPWYVGITGTPKEYYPNNDNIAEALTVKYHFSEEKNSYEPDYSKAWWVYRKLQDEVNKDKTFRTKYVRKFWDQFEENIYTQQANIKKKAMKLYNKDHQKAYNYLTEYCNKTAGTALDEAKKLIKGLEEMDKSK